MKPQDVVSLTTDKSSNIGANFTTIILTLHYLICVLLAWKQWTEFRHDIRIIPIPLTYMHLYVPESLMHSSYLTQISELVWRSWEEWSVIDASNFTPLSPLFLHPAGTISMPISKKVRVWSGCMLLVGTPTMITVWCELAVSLWSGRNPVHDHYSCKQVKPQVNLAWKVVVGRAQGYGQTPTTHSGV